MRLTQSAQYTTIIKKTTAELCNLVLLVYKINTSIDIKDRDSQELITFYTVPMKAKVEELGNKVWSLKAHVTVD